MKVCRNTESVAAISLASSSSNPLSRVAVGETVILLAHSSRRRDCHSDAAPPGVSF